MVFRFIILWVAVQFFAFKLYPQTNNNYYDVKGRVIDKESQLPLEGVGIILKQNDTIRRQIVTNNKGFFKLELLSKGVYQLQFSFLGYKTYMMDLILNKNEWLGEIKLEQTETTLPEIKINETQNRAIQNGDTTEIKANAFKVNVDATAEDLLKKMPGITSENGTLKAQGEEVKKVLVDGKEFFGDDPTIALKNIPADMIEKVQLYGKLSDKASFTGFDDGSEQKTINIITNKSKRNGQFGKAYAGYGYNRVYQGGGNFNKLKNTFKLSVIAMSNNINEQNFSMQDIAGVAGASGGGGGQRGQGGLRGAGGMGGPSFNNSQRQNNEASNFLVNNQAGIATTYAAGINYIDQYNLKTTINASYFFNYAENFNQGLITRQYLTGREAKQLYQEESQSNSFNTNHRFVIKLGYNPDSSNQIILNSRAAIQLNSSYKQQIGNTIINNNIINNSFNQTNTKVNAPTISNSILWLHKFNKALRTFSIELNQSTTQNYPNNYLYSAQSFLLPYFNDTTYSLFSTSVIKSNTTGASISFTEPIKNKNHQIELSFNPRYTNANTGKNTSMFNPLSNTYDSYQPNLSNLFSNTLYTLNQGINYRFTNEAWNITFGTSYQWTALNGNQNLPNVFIVKKNFRNILPNARLQIKLNKNNTLRVFYRTDVTIPTTSQLQTVIDNSNPQLITTGNNNLNQSFNQRLGMRYNYINATNSHNVFVMAVYNTSINYITTYTLVLKNDTMLNNVLLKQGSQLSMPFNTKGYQAFRTFVSYGLPVSIIKCNSNFFVGYTYNKTPAIINDKNYFTYNNNYNVGFNISSNISEKVDFNVGPNIMYAQVISYNKQNISQSDYVISQITFKGQWIFYKGFFIHTNGSYNKYNGLNSKFNVDYSLISGGLGVKFLKNNSGEIRLMIFDILNQNNNINRTVTEAYTEDAQNLVLKRYYMLTFTYSFRYFQSKQFEEKGKLNIEK